MDTTTPDLSHALSGDNPTLFNVVIQYADMDMLRALVLTSHSLYEALQHFRLDHLTMVVLEAPILEEQQQVVYNDADPVPANTFQLPVDDVVTTSTPGTGVPNSLPFDAWQKRTGILNNYSHSLIIPDYARNFMARALSVELIVYRRRLGTRISTFFTDNAHHLKHGQPTALEKCTSCSESNESARATTEYTLHLPCAPTPHCHTGGGHVHGNGDGDSPSCPPDDGCVFSKHPSHEFFEGDEAESRRLKFHMVPSKPRQLSKSFPHDELPSLQLKFLHNITDAGLQNHNETECHTRSAPCPDGHLSIAANPHNTHFYRPRFENLPLVEQQAPTTSLKIHIVDCVSFGVEDWTNAMPGCTIRPMQTWAIRDVGVLRHPGFNFESSSQAFRRTGGGDCVGRHFPRLTSLVLQHTRLDETNRCGVDEFNMPYRDRFIGLSDMSRFFIHNVPIRLPHLQHFGVIGTLLNFEEYANIALHNAHISSLNINPGHQPTKPYSRRVMDWISNLCTTLDGMENSITSSPTAECDGTRQEHTATNPAIHHESVQQVETTPRPRRKYNFSFEFAKSRLERCCPHHTNRELINTPIGEDPSQFAQHLTTCSAIHNALTALDCAHRNDSENSFNWVLSGTPSPNWPSHIPPGVEFEDVLATDTIAKLAQRTLSHLELRCHYCSQTNPGATPFPGACPGDCTATELPPSAGAPLGISDLPHDDGEALSGRPSTQSNKEMYMRLRQLLYIPPHVVLRL